MHDFHTSDARHRAQWRSIRLPLIGANLRWVTGKTPVIKRTGDPHAAFI
jgi:hypothetical protein